MQLMMRLYLSCYALAGPPINVTLYTANSRTLTISWDIPADPEERHGTVVLTSVICDSEGMLGSITGYGVGIERYVTFDGLFPYSNYNCCISLQTTLANSSVICRMAQTPEDGNIHYYQC